MSEQPKSFEEAKAALEFELEQTASFDIDRLYALAETCLNLLTPKDEKNKDLLAGQIQNIHCDFRVNKMGLKGKLLAADTDQKKTAVVEETKRGLRKAIEVLSKFKSMT